MTNFELWNEGLIDELPADERYELVMRDDDGGPGVYVTDCHGHTMPYTSQIGDVNDPQSLDACRRDREALAEVMPGIAIYDIQQSCIVE